MLDTFWRDVRHSLRALASRPAYPLVVVLTLALLIGAGSAVFAVVNATLVRPLPFPDGDRLVRLYTQPPGTTAVKDRNPLHPAEFARFRRGLQTADAVEAFYARPRAVGGEGAEPESVPGAMASAGALPLLGGGPMLGRTWTEAEDRAIARVVVLSHGLWRRRFGGDPGVLGRTLLIDREPHEIIGVMGPEFSLDLVLKADLWTPLGIHGGNAANVPVSLPAVRNTYLQTVARLRPGARVRQLDDEVKAVMTSVLAETPAIPAGWTAAAIDFREFRFGSGTPALILLLVAVAALALLAAANLANITLARAIGRRGELALRAALGASRGNVLRLQIVESLLVSGAGALCGLAIAAWTVPLLLALDPAVAAILGDVRIDWRVQTAAAVLAALVGVASGVLPILRELGGDAAQNLADTSRRAAGGRRDRTIALLLLAGQTAVAVVLLAAGAVVVAGFQRAARVNPGFDPASVLGAQLRLPAAAYPTDAARIAMLDRVLERIRTVPGVEDASTTLNFFVPGFAMQTMIEIEGRPTPDGQPHTVHFRRIGPGYFRTMSIRQLAGRDLAESDRIDRQPVCVVSRSFAERFWPDQDPLQRRIKRGPTTLTVVGMVDDVWDSGLEQAPEPTLYIPYAQNLPATAPIALVVRTARDPLELTTAIRGAVLSVDPAQPLDSVLSLNSFMADSLGPQRFRSTVLVALASLGLAIAAVGIYGLTSRSVAERTREVGVRLALGARPAAVWRLIVLRALGAVGVGLVAGSVIAIGATTLLVKLLPGLDRADPVALAVAAAALVVTATAAAAWPARRAVRIDPVVALRVE